MVTRDTRWPAGTPCWVDVSVDDVPKAIAFYQALFGWDIQAGGPEVGGYAIAHHNGRIVAGLGPKFGRARRPVGLDDLPGRRRRRRGCGEDQGGGRPGGAGADGRHGRGPDGHRLRHHRGRVRPVAGRQDDRRRPGQRDRGADLERARQLGLRRRQGLLPRRVRLRLPGRERGRLPVRDAHGRRARGRRHRPVPAGDADRDPGRLERLLRRRRHRRRRGRRRRARRQRRAAHQGQPVRPDRRRHRQPGRRLLADHQPAATSKPARCTCP